MDNNEFKERKRKVFKRLMSANISYGRSYTDIRKKSIRTKIWHIRSLDQNILPVATMYKAKRIAQHEFANEIISGWVQIEEYVSQYRHYSANIYSLIIRLLKRPNRRITIPENAKRIHLYNFDDILRPRGTLEKESLSLYVEDRLTSSYESWSDPEYGDIPRKKELLEKLKINLISEIYNAWVSFCEKNNIAE